MYMYMYTNNSTCLDQTTTTCEEGARARSRSSRNERVIQKHRKEGTHATRVYIYIYGHTQHTRVRSKRCAKGGELRGRVVLERRAKMDMRRGGSRAAVVFVVVAAAALLHVESAVGQGVPEDSGWYFTETEIGVPFRPSDFQPGANIVNRVEEVAAFCPFGFVSSGCIASTVPPAIANIDIDGPVDFTRSGPLLSVEPNAEVSGFTVYTVWFALHTHTLIIYVGLHASRHDARAWWWWKDTPLYMCACRCYWVGFRSLQRMC